MSISLDSARFRFREYFGGLPDAAARAPGRVNIIGEHTDYNHGFVLPMAIDRETVLLARRRNDHRLRVFSGNFNQEATAELGNWDRHPEAPWLDYLVGVAREVEALGHPLSGADCLLVGDVPIGAGLSSSASVEMAALTLFEWLGGFALPAAEAAALGQRVENEYLGVASGIMDQFIIRAARAEHALFLDCRTYEFEHIPVRFSNATFVITDTGVSRGLAGSKYNERVAECAAAVRALNQAAGTSYTHLRDFALTHLERAAHVLPDPVFRRARHVISENARTREACEALRSGDTVRLGTLLNASDQSLRDDYAVTCPELDAMTAAARSLPGCCGSRMTGAGFGGCTISLVSKQMTAEFSKALHAAYKDRVGREGTSFPCLPGVGSGPAANLNKH